MSKPTGSTGLLGLLNGPQVRRIERDEQVRYAAVDVISVLVESPAPAAYWTELLRREPQLASLAESAEFAGPDGRAEKLAAVSLEGVLRLVQSIESPRCERIKMWLANSAVQRLEEAENPELVALRARRLYEQKGYSRRWVDKRLRGISGRHELTSEWYKRGATHSDEFRLLTNELMSGAFGMDVESYRRYKNLQGTRANLRDHMTDMELALTSLGEMAAVALHQARGSKGLEPLVVDAKDAGRVVAQARDEIEKQTGRPVASPENAGRIGRRRTVKRPGSDTGEAGAKKDTTDEGLKNRVLGRGAGDGSPAAGDGGPSRDDRSPDRGGPPAHRASGG
jgi:DNA-damage-inducible protein D